MDGVSRKAQKTSHLSRSVEDASLGKADLLGVSQKGLLLNRRELPMQYMRSVIDGANRAE